jgi:hypothetical protein
MGTLLLRLGCPGMYPILITIVTTALVATLCAEPSGILANKSR